MIGEISSSGRFCQAFTSSSTASVILLMVSRDSWVPNVRAKWASMSRTVIPPA